MPLILASTSRYRRELLSRLALPFETRQPGVDESPLPGETPEALVERLAIAKADAVARAVPEAVVIGSDQVAIAPDGRVLGKPGDAETARAQLQSLSGRRARFLTALAVREPRGGTLRHGIVATDVDFRRLDARAIARYVEIEQPLDCAGSFKSEGLGIVLFERIVSDDPTALIGLPLILLNRFLRLAGLDPLAAPDTPIT